MMIIPQCVHCKHFLHVNKRATCTAFPHGIPTQIIANKFDHTKPFPGDHGVQFKQDPKCKSVSPMPWLWAVPSQTRTTTRLDGSIAIRPVKAAGPADEARDKSGKWTKGGDPFEADRKKFYELKAQMAQLNTDLLPYMNNPTAPEVQDKMNQMKLVVMQISKLNADPGGVKGIGLPGGPKDLLIVGGGPGGLASSVMGAADGLETTVIEAGPQVGGQAKFSSRIENYPGFPIGVTGKQLTDTMVEQATRMGAAVNTGTRVTGFHYNPETGIKTVTLDNGQKVEARAVILAGGVEFRKLSFPGSNSEDIVYGNAQMLKDRYAGKPVVVIGGSNGASQAALGAAQTASQVYLISRSPIEKGMSDYQVQAVRNHSKIQVIENDSIARAFLDDQGHVKSIETMSGKKLAANGVGIFAGSAPKTEWLPPEIHREEGKIKTDINLETAIPGVFAIGDIRVGSIGRIGAAVGDGQMAERGAFQYFDRLKEQENSKAVAASTSSNQAEVEKIIKALFELDKQYPEPLSQSVEEE